ncbi:MAG TPA: YdeI/OmpD-associated family protein [Planctomycetota bacterium]|nr:YdeI/OmpD-associated family protein [Planctomycetota bacterium]
MKTVVAKTASQWRKWLDGHHDSESEVWLVFHKQHTGVASIAYLDALFQMPATLHPRIQAALKKHPTALRCFEGLAPSHRRKYVGWIGSAKREETKARRLQEAIRLLSAGTPLGLK